MLLLTLMRTAHISEYREFMLIHSLFVGLILEIFVTVVTDISLGYSAKNISLCTCNMKAKSYLHVSKMNIILYENNCANKC